MKAAANRAKAHSLWPFPQPHSDLYRRTSSSLRSNSAANKLALSLFSSVSKNIVQENRRVPPSTAPNQGSFMRAEQTPSPLGIYLILYKVCTYSLFSQHNQEHKNDFLTAFNYRIKSGTVSPSGAIQIDTDPPGNCFCSIARINSKWFPCSEGASETLRILWASSAISPKAADAFGSRGAHPADEGNCGVRILTSVLDDWLARSRFLMKRLTAARVQTAAPWLEREKPSVGEGSLRVTFAGSKVRNIRRSWYREGLGNESQWMIRT